MWLCKVIDRKLLLNVLPQRLNECNDESTHLEINGYTH